VQCSARDLFADIKGSTELMREQELDLEEARGIIDPAPKLKIEALCCYDGYVVQSIGNGDLSPVRRRRSG
jgi:hypothetical protein